MLGRYRVDEVRYTDELKDVLMKAGKGGGKATLLLLSGPNTDSGKITRPAAFDGECKRLGREHRWLFNNSLFFQQACPSSRWTTSCCTR